MHINEIKAAGERIIRDRGVTLATSRQTVMRTVYSELPDSTAQDRARVVAHIENTLLDAASR